MLKRLSCLLVILLADGLSREARASSGVDFSITKIHVGNFAQGDPADTYSISLTNTGGNPSSMLVTVTDTLPVGLTATAMTGTGWTCVLPTLTCTRSDALAAGGTYPPITLTVSVALNAAASVINSVMLTSSEDGFVGNNISNDPTTIVPAPDLVIAKHHTGNFRQGQSGAAYTLTVSNSGPAKDTQTSLASSRWKTWAT